MPANAASLREEAALSADGKGILIADDSALG